ncbi:MAG: type II toxin-antitoxin system RelB/DinJ family antitoxin [Ruminiclostridium sp.]|nr:type II toxin-antitoxin system RelB/DinJ family antitoxin [Ruminiclostridium sp.]MBR1833472.1 type II toxin-antitoxin system RelB/DinJ family antitoxin [Ruminiclostridium sp.]
MAKTETLHIRVNEQVKTNAEETLDMLGISISEAVNMFLCQVNLTGGLPFAVKLPAPERVMVRSKTDLINKLDEADANLKTGKVSDAKDTFGRLRSRHNV